MLKSKNKPDQAVLHTIFAHMIIFSANNVCDGAQDERIFQCTPCSDKQNLHRLFVRFELWLNVN
jgi:hypothetical protein